MKLTTLKQTFICTYEHVCTPGLLAHSALIHVRCHPDTFRGRPCNACVVRALHPECRQYPSRQCLENLTDWQVLAGGHVARRLVPQGL